MNPSNNTIPLLSIHTEIYKQLNEFYVSGKIPHIIFHGTNGTGKRTIVDDFLNLIYDKDKSKMKTNVMYVNCAHGKGIKFIREELKFFAKTNIKLNTGVIFKTIVLLNADNLTIDAQSALRRCIELFSVNTRFFIIVENKHKLLNPILSRFCEIYVPEIYENGHVLNLHKYKIDRTYNFTIPSNDDPHIKTVDIETYKTNAIDKILKPLLKLCDFNSIHLDLDKNRVNQHNMDNNAAHIFINKIVTNIYECGLSCIDFMKWVEKTQTQNNSAIIHICFQKIKSDFRCEKLLLSYMLDYTFLRSDTSLKNLGFL